MLLVKRRRGGVFNTDYLRRTLTQIPELLPIAYRKARIIFSFAYTTPYLGRVCKSCLMDNPPT